MISSTQKHSCVTCAHRKVKCNKLNPCSNCSRSQSECVYTPPAISQRHRKRFADEDLLSKISEYEDLLHMNNIKFQPLDNSWISSSLEGKLLPRSNTTPPRSSGSLQASSESQWHLDPQNQTRQSQPEFKGTHTEAACLWSRLPKELLTSPIKLLKRPEKYLEADATETSSSSRISSCLLIPVKFSEAPKLLELHPEPKHIFKLWQAFVENVNPLTKIIHVPTLQRRILDMSWNLESVTKPLEAVMFGVYALGITSMKALDCIQAFGETKSILLNRFRSGLAQALIAAELHLTRDLEVLQAFVLFLILDPKSELSATTVAIAMRIGHRMGLHRTGADPHMPFFEEEMRLRVWWQIIGLDSSTRRKALSLPPAIVDYGNIRLPMNINDADLHPNMAHRPAIEYPGATEMLYCLMKYEVAFYVRSLLAVAAVTTTKELIASTNPNSITKKIKLLTDLEELYETRYLCYCDSKIPLHQISATVARLTIYRSRFSCYHPRHQPNGGQHMSQADLDLVFESSIKLLQLNFDKPETTFSPHLVQCLLEWAEVDALVYMVSELRHRVSGDLVAAAWVLLGRMYEDYPQLLQCDVFFTALADLTLKAWEARKQDVDANGGDMPQFIIGLQAMRGNLDTEGAPAAMIGDMMLNEDFQLGLVQDDPLDWLYWNELPQL